MSSSRRAVHLITDLLVAQWNRYGRLRLGSFWARRARRLLPALATMLVVVTAATAIIEPGQLAALRGRGRPRSRIRVTGGRRCSSSPTSPSSAPGHPRCSTLWSLAIEEQFYLVWPLLLIVLLTYCQSSRLPAGCRLAVRGPVRPGHGADLRARGRPVAGLLRHDTHSSAILVGAALALSWPLCRLRTLTTDQARITDGFGLAGLALLGWAVGHYRGDDRALYPAGLLIAALSAGAVVLAAASPGVISWLLGLPPLRWIGVRSYGIYLWHWPVIALTTAALARTRPGPLIWAAEAAMAVGLAAASWRWIEQPIIRDGFRVTARSRVHALASSLRVMHRAPAGIFPAAAGLAAAAVLFTAGYGVLSARGSSGLAAQISQGVRVSQHDLGGQNGAPSASPSPALAAGQAAPAASLSAATPSATVAPAGGSPATDPPRTAPAAARVSGAQVTAIGDSVMLASAPELQHALRGIAIDAQVSRQVGVGLSLVQQLATAGALRHVLVFALGTNGSFTAQQMHHLLQITGPGRELVLVNTYEARPWQAGDNQLIDTTARRLPNVFLANWFSTIEHRTSLLWPDEVHPQPPGARLYARMVAKAVRAALAASSSGPAGRRAPPCPARPLP